MKLIAALGVLAAGVIAHPIYATKIGERELAINVGQEIPKLAMTASGKFVVTIPDSTGTRIYWVTRSNTVQGLKYLPNILIKEMIAIGDDVVVVGRSGSNTASNTYAGRFGLDGVQRWQTIIDASGVNTLDSPTDVTLGPNNAIYTTGYTGTGLGSYVHCMSLNATTGALRFRAVRSTMSPADSIEATTNGLIHVFGPRAYWRLNAAGVTQTVASQPAPVWIQDTATNGTDIYAVGYRTEGRRAPYIQKRNNIGALQWQSNDPSAIGAVPPGGENEYNVVKIDGGGNAYAAGLLTSGNNQYARMVRFAAASGNALSDTFFFQQPNEEFRTAPLTLDQFNNPYYTLRLEATNASNTTYKFDTQLSSTIFTMQTAFGPIAEFGPQFSTVVHPASGDFVVVQRRSNPNYPSWQIWKQPALPVADSYVVAGANFNSPTSVLANDRFRESAALELVSTTTKGTLNLNTTTGHFTYVKNPGASGAVKFVYRLRKNGLVGVAATVNLAL